MALFSELIIAKVNKHLENPNAMPEPAIVSKEFVDALKDNKGVVTIYPDTADAIEGTGRDRQKSSFNKDYCIIKVQGISGDISGHLNLSARQVRQIQDTGCVEVIAEATESEYNGRKYYNVKATRVLIQPTQ